ncbi:30S ribosomal protein S6 [Candidatus Haliotispira prima]|uniref:Small ribosomal subunit protein bS6 n=1 Tax=Candidatus Haliotispira prima TaxID=3034016 RepID=A0ABY8MF61_9SPIO|nr:30S ribosomal protein S6 [Candidatus Haliotispira prima]
MEQYELTLLFSVRGDLYKTGSDTVREVLQKINGKISKEEDMGERPLAYPVRKEEHGHYLSWDIEFDGSAVQSLKEAIQAHTAVLKYLLVKK